MNLGIIVDGQAEFRSLPLLLSRVSSPYSILRPIYADLQPRAPVGQIVKEIRKKVPILAQKGATRVVVLIDSESDNCPRSWPREIEMAYRKACLGDSTPELYVVAKHPCYENWLIGDEGAVKGLGGRFQLRGALAKGLNGNADSIDALELLRSMAIKDKYSKVEDAKRIMAKADPLSIALHSRSFRRFLRTLESPVYAMQSRRAYPRAA